MSWIAAPRQPENPHPPQTWQNAGICPKCKSGDYPAFGRHHIRWQETDTMSGGGWLEAQCHRCYFTWQIKAADE